MASITEQIKQIDRKIAGLGILTDDELADVISRGEDVDKVLEHQELVIAAKRRLSVTRAALEKKAERQAAKMDKELGEGFKQDADSIKAEIVETISRAFAVAEELAAITEKLDGKRLHEWQLTARKAQKLNCPADTNAVKAVKVYGFLQALADSRKRVTSTIDELNRLGVTLR